MKEVMKYLFPILPILPSLTSTDGYMDKTKKSVIAKILEQNGKDTEKNIENNCVILDAVVTCHSISTSQKHGVVWLNKYRKIL